jgi:hypothetical protein
MVCLERSKGVYVEKKKTNLWQKVMGQLLNRRAKADPSAFDSRTSSLRVVCQNTKRRLRFALGTIDYILRQARRLLNHGE